MKKKLIILVIAIFTSSLIINTVSSEEIGSTSHKITIDTGERDISIVEMIVLSSSSAEGNEIFNFWIQTGAYDIGLFIKGTSVNFNQTSDNLFTSNISSLEIDLDSQTIIEIKYKLEKNIDNFEKELIRNSSSVNVVFDDITLYTGENLVMGSSFTLSLFTPTEAPLSLYLIVGIVLLVVLLVVVTIYFLKKPKATKIKKSSSESEELLNTKKSLLMSLLKDIEKQHRAKQINDDTYHKLKEQYKQEAVDAMKKLEDMGSKIK